MLEQASFEVVLSVSYLILIGFKFNLWDSNDMTLCFKLLYIHFMNSIVLLLGQIVLQTNLIFLYVPVVFE